MKFRKLPVICSLCSLCFAPFSLAQSPIIYANGFDSIPLGPVSDDDVKAAWQSRYAKGPDEGRVTIISDSRTGNAVRIQYPDGGNQSSRSGATWETDLNYSGEDLYMSYWVKFDDDFQFVKGGKLPGLGGSTEFPYGDFEFTTRLMWREDGKLEFYVHGYNVNNSQGAEPYRIFWDDAGYHARVNKGQWHHIEIRQKLNTPGQRDGRLQGWLDGELVCDNTDNSGTRGSGETDTRINHLYFSTFFGGSSAPASQWQPKADVYATFDDFTVSTSRIGVDGFPGDTSGGSDDDDSDNGSGDSGTGGDQPDTGDCIALQTGNIKHEIDLTTSSCVMWNETLSGKTLAVWDSDTNKSCNFRGVVTAIDGTGSIDVQNNYEVSANFNATTIDLTSNNECDFVKLRAM